jgi:hypothetical protein
MDNDPNLSLQEFTEMLFSNDETLTINLQGLTAPSREQIEEVNEFSKSVTAAKTQDMSGWDQDSLNKLRIKNQWKLNFQSKITDIMRDVMNLDDKKTEQVDAREFMRILETRIRSSEN